MTLSHIHSGYSCSEQPVQAPNREYWCFLATPKWPWMQMQCSSFAHTSAIRAYCQIYYCVHKPSYNYRAKLELLKFENWWMWPNHLDMCSRILLYSDKIEIGCNISDHVFYWSWKKAKRKQFFTPCIYSAIKVNKSNKTFSGKLSINGLNQKCSISNLTSLTFKVPSLPLHCSPHFLKGLTLSRKAPLCYFL